MIEFLSPVNTSILILILVISPASSLSILDHSLLSMNHGNEIVVLIGDTLLLDDGKLRMTVLETTMTKGPEVGEVVCQVVNGGALSNKKGVNTPSIILPISPMTPKDRKDLEFILTLDVDWVALSFVQKPEDMVELRNLAGPKLRLMAKLEKPSAIDYLDDIVSLSVRKSHRLIPSCTLPSVAITLPSIHSHYLLPVHSILPLSPYPFYPLPIITPTPSLFLTPSNPALNPTFPILLPPLGRYHGCSW